MALEAGQTGVLAIGASSGNVLAGRTFEFVPRTWRRGAYIRIAAISSTVAAVDSTATFTIDDRSVFENATVSFDSVVRAIKMSDDVIGETWAPAGARLRLTFKAGAVAQAASGINWKVVLDPA